VRERQHCPLLAGIAAAVLLAGWVSLRARLQPGGAQPRAVFERARQDLGPVPAGGSAEARFPVRNAGAGPLRVVSVHGSCGCLTSGALPVIAPHASGEIRVAFVPQADWSGRVEKDLTVRTDDPAQPETRLVLAADVLPLVRIDPSGTLEVPYRPGTVYRREVRLTPRKGSRVHLGRALSESPLVKPVLFPPGPDDSPESYRLQVTAGPWAGPGDAITDIRVPTSDPRLPELLLVVAARAQVGPVVEPAEVFLPTITPGHEGTELARMRVFSRSGPLRLLKVETGSPALRAEIVPQPGGTGYHVPLTYLGGWSPGTVRGTIRVHTDDRLFPLVTVPLHAAIR
jgi:hypothetical protein